MEVKMRSLLNPAIGRQILGTARGRPHQFVGCSPLPQFLFQCPSPRCFSAAPIFQDGNTSNHIYLREYQNVWSTGEGDFHLPTIIDDIRLDRQSRHILQLLQTMYQTGLTRTPDRITTEQCNYMIQRLSKMESGGSGDQEHADLAALNHDNEGEIETTSDDKPPTQQSDKKTSLCDYWLRCERARAILESMELFRSIQTDGQLPVALPTPTHETYFQVLRMYGSKQLLGDSHEDMQQAPLYAQDIVERMEASEELGLQPSAMHWNQVLSAYAHSSRDKRQLEAAALLYELHGKSLTDESSFSHVLRSCLDMSEKRSDPGQKEKYAEVSIAVAQRVWKGLNQKVKESNNSFDSKNKNVDLLAGLMEGSVIKTDGSIELQAYHVLHMMRVARNFAHLTSLDTESINTRQMDWISTTLQECIDSQKINIHVLLEVVYQASEIAERSAGEADALDVVVSIFPESGNTGSIQKPLDSFRGKRQQAVSRSPGRIAKEILRQIPDGWKAKAE